MQHPSNNFSVRRFFVVVTLTVSFLITLDIGVADSGISAIAPKKEVRAVWIATTAGLDWPKTQDRVEQQSSLKKFVDDLKAAHFNTILFQVRARGDAYYRSSYEPWAENLTGTLGNDPGWDPLAFLIDEAHAARIEVHAWFNVYKVRGLSAVPPSVPPHPSRRFPAWTHDVDGEGWLDPGVPEVREYLLRVALELVRRYDVDGINFDFIRYPGRNFPDDETYYRYGHGRDRNDWRRSNIDNFVSAFYDSAMHLKPMLKVGSAPLGVFTAGSGENGGGAYNSYYQDSRRWLREGKHDYLVPQVYWDLGMTKDDPDFASVLRSWESASSGRQVWAGIAAYKPEVMRELAAEIDSSRAIGSDGEAFFRYEHVKGMQGLDDRYQHPANIPPMPWKDSIPPLQPKELAVTETSPSIFHLEWLAPPRARDGDTPRYYDIYRSTSENIEATDGRMLVAISPTNATFFVDTVPLGGGYRYYYAVSALDKGNNEGPLSDVASVTMKELTELRGKLSVFTTLSASLANDEVSATLVAYKLAARSSISLLIEPETGYSTTERPVILAEGMKDAGTYVVGVPKHDLKPGSYIVKLVAGGVTLEQPIEMR